MLVIRMQRTGRKGHAMFRVVVQDSRRTPTSGKIVAQLGSYDPHSKAVILDKEKASFYVTHGAQPSDRAAKLLQTEGVDLPSWVRMSATKERTVRNADKRRSTSPPAPVEEAAPEPEAPVEEPAAEEAVAPEAEAPVEATEAAEPAVEEAVEPAAETPAETPSEEASTDESTEEPAAE